MRATSKGQVAIPKPINDRRGTRSGGRKTSLSNFDIGSGTHP